MKQKPSIIASQLKEICPDLALHIARCTEQAYRRGYQQGALYGKDLDAEVAEWRFRLPDDFSAWTQSTSIAYDISPAPPGSFNPHYSTSAVERLSMEADNCSEVIASLTRLETK